MIGGLTALRWRRLGSHNLLVVDRAAFFSILKRYEEPLRKRNKGPLGPLEARIQHIVWELRRAWHPPLVVPSWRLHFESFPDLWNKTGPFLPAGNLKKLSRVAFDSCGLVGMDIKSHQVFPRAILPTPWHMAMLNWTGGASWRAPVRVRTMCLSPPLRLWPFCVTEVGCSRLLLP